LKETRTDETWVARGRRDRQRKLEKGRYRLIPDETNVFRVLRTPDSTGKHAEVYKMYLMHPDVGPRKQFLRCGKTVKGIGRCWLCDKKIPKLERLGKTTHATAIAADEQISYQVAAVNETTGEMRGPLIYSMHAGGPKSYSYRLLSTLLRKPGIVDHKKGRNLSVERSGSGMLDTSYHGPTIDENQSEVPEGIIRRLKPFHEVLPRYSEAAQKAAYYGRDGGAQTNEEESMAVGKKKKFSKHHEEEEELEEDQETEEESEEEEVGYEEQEEERPHKTFKKKPFKKKPFKKKSSRDEEEEEEPEEESEEQESEEEESEEEESEEEDSEGEEDQEEESEGEEEERRPKTKFKKPFKKKPARQEEEEESEEEESEEENYDEVEEEEPEEEEEEERVVHKKKPISKKPFKKKR
jgi:DNA segregation ATPase FtsK/SpoIIIE-like protein